VLQRLAQVGVPAQGGGAVAGRQLALHQRTVRRFVLGVDLCQSLPLAAGAQQLQLPLTQPFACGLGPRLEARTGQQIAGVGRGDIGAVGGVTLRECGIGTLLKALRIHHDRAFWPQHHLPGLQHDAVVTPQCLACVVRGLSEVGGTGLGLKLWPQRIDHFVPRQPLVGLQAQQLHQLSSAQAGPAVGPQFDTIDGDGEAAEQEGVEAGEGPWRHVGQVDVHAV